ncbi:acyltransferase [Ktedonosporobacter rubrisoli]|uniref:Acyltransferase n=1 Tax=Ktedonosporobacter rubrisoli TaxID=2509675 RepID=A0A4P6JZX3_KTERU|nr:acyltransferase family protein [Ktedonosporobacter rubrisoli]QBD81073.1 acyltransferase [Ktedonosporobacter rubrisoli]
MSQGWRTSVSRDSSIQVTTHLVAGARPRLFFIDHIRVALTILVILHHLAITYGGYGVWYYQEANREGLTRLLAIFFVLINQSFFMGCFFLISAYFTPASYDRKGAGNFLKDRLLRLGVPLLIYIFVISPFANYVGQELPGPYWQFLSHYGLAACGSGPLWFVEALLLFECLYVLYRKLSEKWVRQSDKISSKPPTFSILVLFSLALAVITFLVMIWFPFGWTFNLLNFIPSNFPQYICLYCLGLLAARRNWFVNVPGRLGKLGLWSALGATLVLFPLAIFIDVPAYAGGIHWQAFVYALWESIMGLGVSMGLIVFFRQRLNRQGRWGKFLSTHAYAVYIIHAPVIVCLGFALHSLSLYPALKFALAACVGVLLCFGCAYLLRKLPGASKII